MLDDLTAALDKEELQSEAASSAIPETNGDQPLMDPDSGCALPEDEDSAILTMIAQDGVSMQDMFKLNDW
jgi:hypothetical protein